MEGTFLTVTVMLFSLAFLLHNAVLYYSANTYYNSPPIPYDPSFHGSSSTGSPVPRRDLFDLGHMLFPDFRSHEYLMNVILLVMVGVFVLFGRQRRVAGRMILGFMVPLFTLRMLTTLTTILPAHSSVDTTWKRSCLVNGHAYDKVFSGHTCLAILLAYVMSLFSPPGLSWAYKGLAVAEGFFAIATKGHYTVDVVMAIIITLSFIKMEIFI